MHTYCIQKQKINGAEMPNLIQHDREGHAVSIEKTLVGAFQLKLVFKGYSILNMLRNYNADRRNQTQRTIPKAGTLSRQVP